MPRPYFFSWVDEPVLAACAWPDAAENLAWLRKAKIDIIITLTEEPLPRNWIDSAGLMSVHVPVPDMDAPTPEQIDKCMSIIDKARTSNMGVVVHCLAGRGRTGTILATYFVNQGMSATEAITKVRHLRPGSIEAREQEAAVRDYEHSLRNK
jgi:atypical dual specificity phosphatase